MKSPINQLQKAIVQTLKADADVVALIGGRIYDRVPEGAEFPYISFGAIESRSFMADCLDLAEITVQLDCWSRKAGFGELREIAEAVRQALHDKDLTLERHAMVTITHERTHELYDPDGTTTHAALIFAATIERE